MSWIKLFFFVILLECCTILTQQSRHERFEYKYSFKGPYLAQKDFTVPFFKYDNSAIVSEEMVRLVPSLRSKKGRIWTKLATSFDWWEVEIWFRVTGRGKIGADGLSFFYTDQILPEGSLFGSSEHFNGLAVIFDSFDNDNKGNNPYIMAMVNDGTKTYNHDTDGFNQQIASCIRDFRNKPFPVRAKIEYYENKLSVLIHNGNTKNDEDYELCFEARDVYLPKYGHFGVSAATGDLADDHDVLKFLTHSLYQPGKIQNVLPDTNEKEKYDKEYEAFKQKIDQKETDYYKSHPDEAKKHKNDLDTEYESLGEKEFQQILSIQSEAHELLRNLNHKLDEILGKQERSLTVLNYIQNGQVANVQQGGQPTGHIPFPFQRHEFEALLGQQNELISNSRQIKNSIVNMANVANNQPASVQQASQFNQQILSETKEGVNKLRTELASIGTKLMSQMPHASAQTLDKCPTCLTSTTFFVAVFIQIGVFIGYNIYKSSSDSQTKKFY